MRLEMILLVLPVAFLAICAMAGEVLVAQRRRGNSRRV
jgi:hypothetical protein